jgi:glycosyltransferase involved in cell wall biosynthesis
MTDLREKPIAAFFGLAKAFDFPFAGGTHSYLRRLSLQWAQMGYRTDFVTFGEDQAFEVEHAVGVRTLGHVEFHQALRTLLDHGYPNVISAYLPPKYRMLYAGFRLGRRKRSRYHAMLWAWPEAWWRREAQILDSRVVSHNGAIFAVSPRLARWASKSRRKAVTILPPVSENYWTTPEDKPEADSIRVRYLGRLDPDKGAGFALDLMNRLVDDPTFSLHIHGIYWDHDPKTMRLHRELSEQDAIHYRPRLGSAYQPEQEEEIASVLKETDVLILPYRKLSSTIDTPALLLEGMAACCAVLTPRLGDIGELYGESPFLLPADFTLAHAEQIIRTAKDQLSRERSRIVAARRKLVFRQEDAAQAMLAHFVLD